MIELRNNVLTFRFPEVHSEAEVGINFQRTLRIPDDNREYLLPPGLGSFPLQHVDDFAEDLPEWWVQHGGVLLPMYQSEALWISFYGDYPCAVKIAAGKINAVSGEPWRNSLSDSPQDYVVIPNQPWLDGFNVSKDHVRQFVAMPLGEGYTAEEQITGKAEHGGLQIVAYPMKREEFAKIPDFRDVNYSPQICESPTEMGLGAGGLMRQEIYEDEYGIDAWDQKNGFRCFVHLVNSEQYSAITGQEPPHKPPTAKYYTSSGLPWFDYYSDSEAVAGSDVLGKLTSVAARMIEKGDGVMADNDPVQPKVVKVIKMDNIVRDGKF